MGQFRALNHAQAHAAAAHDGDARARPDLGGVPCRAHARHHTAGDQTRLVKRHLLGHLNCCLAMHDGMGRKCAAAQHLRTQGVIALAMDALFGAQRRVAVARVAASAGGTLLTGGAVRYHDGIARLQMGHALACLLHIARALVSQHNRERHSAALLVLDGQIGMADAARHHANQHLPRPRSLYGDVFQHGRRSRLVQQNRLSLSCRHVPHLLCKRFNHEEHEGHGEEQRKNLSQIARIKQTNTD